MKQIPVTRGRFALVDDEDFEALSKAQWFFSNGYARRNPEEGNPNSASMHRSILDPPSHLFIDHIDGNRLNNQRANLRICTKNQNMRNSRLRKDSRSGLKGATFHSRSGRWRAKITINGKRIEIGSFATPEAAHDAYCARAKEAFGEFFNAGKEPSENSILRLSKKALLEQPK